MNLEEALSKDYQVLQTGVIKKTKFIYSIFSERDNKIYSNGSDTVKVDPISITLSTFIYPP